MMVIVIMTYMPMVVTFTRKITFGNFSAKIPRRLCKVFKVFTILVSFFLPGAEETSSLHNLAVAV